MYMNFVKPKNKPLGPAKLSRKQLARYRCNDCSVNVVTIGEFYMTPPEIWEGELGLGWDDNLCIGCLETRLGRKVRTWLEIVPVSGQYRWSKPTSERLMDRLGLEKKSDGEWRPKSARIRCTKVFMRRSETAKKETRRLGRVKIAA